MSHRVTTETEMRDRELVKAACRQQGVSFTEHGDSMQFTSGPLSNSTLNLRTGHISGDTDFGHTKQTLGLLKQAYGEEKYRFECTKQGIQVESREKDRHGNIILICAMA